MSFTIDEVNAERQFLLARLLNPPTMEVLNRIPSPERAVSGDLGCGQGNDAAAGWCA